MHVDMQTGTDAWLHLPAAPIADFDISLRYASYWTAVSGAAVLRHQAAGIVTLLPAWQPSQPPDLTVGMMTHAELSAAAADASAVPLEHHAIALSHLRRA